MRWQLEKFEIRSIHKQREQREQRLKNKHPKKKFVPAVILLLIVKTRECAKAKTGPGTHTHTRTHAHQCIHSLSSQRNIYSNMYTFWKNDKTDDFSFSLNSLSFRFCLSTRFVCASVCGIKHVAYLLALKVNHHLLFY